MRKILHPFVAIATIGLAACQDHAPVVAPTSTTTKLVSDSTVHADILSSSGDALASRVEALAANEIIDLPAVSNSVASAFGGITVSRVRGCYDAKDQLVPGCKPWDLVRKIITDSKEDGSRSGSDSTRGGSATVYSGAVHRTATDTMVRVFDNSTETQHVHTALSVGHDTTTFSDPNVSRNMTEAARDAVNGVTWKLPKGQNPFPTAGSIVRLDSVHVVAVKGTKTETRDVVESFEIDFPADAQGNVTLKTNGKTCTLNLVTHVVANCK